MPRGVDAEGVDVVCVPVLGRVVRFRSFFLRERESKSSWVVVDSSSHHHFGWEGSHHQRKKRPREAKQKNKRTEKRSEGFVCVPFSFFSRVFIYVRRYSRRAHRVTSFFPLPRGSEEVEREGEEIVVDKPGVHAEEAHHRDHVASEVPSVWFDSIRFDSIRFVQKHAKGTNGASSRNYVTITGDYS